MQLDLESQSLTARLRDSVYLNTRRARSGKGGSLPEGPAMGRSQRGTRRRGPVRQPTLTRWAWGPELLGAQGIFGLLKSRAGGGGLERGSGLGWLGQLPGGLMGAEGKVRARGWTSASGCTAQEGAGGSCSPKDWGAVESSAPSPAFCRHRETGCPEEPQHGQAPRTMAHGLAKGKGRIVSLSRQKTRTICTALITVLWKRLLPRPCLPAWPWA